MEWIKRHGPFHRMRDRRGCFKLAKDKLYRANVPWRNLNVHAEAKDDRVLVVVVGRNIMQWIP